MKFKLVKLKKSDPIFNSGFIFTNQKIINMNKKTSQNSEDGQLAARKKNEKAPAKGNVKMNSYNDKDLFKRYLKLFGDEPPFPPANIMKTLVKMKEDGTFEEKLDLVKDNKTKKIVNTIEKLSGEKMSLNHPFFDIDFDKDT